MNTLPRQRQRFRFIVSPTTTGTIDCSEFVTLGDLADAVLRRQKHCFELDGIVLFPQVTDPLIYAHGDWKVHKRSCNAYYVGRNVDFLVWKRARHPRRLAIALDNLVQSVEQIPERVFCAESRTRVVRALHNASEKARQ